MKKFITYILKSEKIDKFYIGYTSDIEKRILKHNNGSSNWTRKGIPWQITYTKSFETKAEAMEYEKFLKSLKNKNFLKKIIAG